MIAASFLGRIGGIETYLPLLKALSHQAPMVRHNALNALGYLGQSNLAINAVEKILNNPSEELFVKHSAIQLIQEVRFMHMEDKAIKILEFYINNDTTPGNMKGLAERGIRTLNASRY